MRDKTLYLSDLDGTLLQNDASLSPFAVRELNRMIEKGLCFSISSARSTGTVIGILDGLRLTVPIALFNGDVYKRQVITSDGLIGVIEEVGLTYSRVITLHDPSLNVGAYVSRTRDTGIVVGAVDLAQDGQCKMTYLPRDSGAAIGDMILTSGGNVFPKGLKIGTIKEIRQESHGVSLYAVIEPFASVADAKDVFVITSFEGQGIVVGEDLGQNDAPIEESEANEDTSSLPAADSSSVEAGQ